MSTFADLRRNAQAELETLTKEAEKHAGTGGFERDARYWRPVLDSAGNGNALIRFLPRPDGEKFPFVKKYSYGFKGPTGRWYIENSPQTIGMPCPVNERWAALWGEGTDDAKEKSKIFKRRMSFISNIVVIKHPARGDDEGKVFLFEYGKRIYDKLNDKMNPSFPDIKAYNPFDPDLGANFRLRVMKKDGFTNYDKSEFDAPGAFADDASMEKVWRQSYSLDAEIAPDKFKPYAELKTKLEQVTGGASAAAAPLAPAKQSSVAAPPWEEDTTTQPATQAAGAADAADGELDWFKRLAAT